MSLRVLHVIESLGRGGAEMNLVSQVRHLSPARFEQHVAWMYDADQLVSELEPHVRSLVPLRVGNHGGILSGAVRLARWIRRHRPDVVHAQLIRAQLTARLGALLGGDVPVVTTWQNANYEPFAVSDFGTQRRLRAVRAVDRITGLRDAHFVAVSKYVAEHLCQHLGVPAARVSIVYNAVSPSRYAPVPAEQLAELRRELRLEKNARVLLNLGRLVPQKAQRDLVEAMPQVIRRHPDTVLLIAGDGQLAAELRSACATLGLGDHVRLLGARRDAGALLQLADVFAFPSIYEGLSVALAEAAANGLPLVASDIPQNREVGEGIPSTRFVAPRRPEALATAIADLLDDLPSARAHAKAATAEIIDRFSPSTLANALGDVLAAAAGS
jgi:glycosyltransferase involved in cell wall biosynthesis